jgi:phytanoyl-CoA hydroxylase
MQNHDLTEGELTRMQTISDWPDCPTRLTAPQIARFREEGYLAFNNLFTPDEVATARDHISTLVTDLAAGPGVMAPNGHLLSHPTSRFAVQFEQGSDLSDLDGEALELKVRKLMWYCEADAFFAEQSTQHPKIQGLLQDLLGPDCTMFQDMALLKPPHIGSIKPWHQDNAYFTMLPLDAVVGVWIALDPATVENGCMHVIPGGHKAGPLCHYHDRDCEIIPDRIDPSAALPIELASGGALFFYGMLPHQTPTNQSDQRRRALQWHYHSANARTVSQAEFDQVFAEADGTPASCLAAGQRNQTPPTPNRSV